MSYRSIVVHVDASRHAQHRIESAARLAMACEAHLIGAAMTGISRFVQPDDTPQSAHGGPDAPPPLARGSVRPRAKSKSEAPDDLDDLRARVRQHQ